MTEGASQTHGTIRGRSRVAGAARGQTWKQEAGAPGTKGLGFDIYAARSPKAFKQGKK